MAFVHVEPAAWALLAAGTAGYAIGVRRLGKRSEAQDRWPAWRSWCFAGSALTVAVATTSPLPSNAANHPTQGAVAHVLLILVAPLLLAGAAPATLAVEAGSRDSARRVRSVMTARAVRIIASPWIAWPLFAGSLSAVYATHLHTAGARHEWVGQPLQLALFVVGCVFLWPVFGSDPRPAKLSPFPAMVYLLGLLPYFTLLGMAVESKGAGSVLQTQGSVAAAAAVGSNVQGAGGILWTVGGLGSVALTVLVLVRWLRAEERATPSRDSGLDPAAVAQLRAWREQREAAAAEEASYRSQNAQAKQTSTSG